MITWISPDDPVGAFPPTEAALAEPAGLLAAGGDLSAPRLLAAYARGIFPWYSPGQPILWWSPDPREVLRPDRLYRSRSLRRTMRRERFELHRDRDFPAVLRACAAPRARSPGTWITAAMHEAYCQLHALGVAHSFEIWRAGSLVGGVYGVHVGRVFCGESMFSRATDGSKAALAGLADWCLGSGCALIDCQFPSAHLRSLGSEPMRRSTFLTYLAPATA